MGGGSFFNLPGAGGIGIIKKPNSVLFVGEIK
jgi:hypothetical protein